MSPFNKFTSSVAENYEKFMAPMFFAPYAKDTAARLSIPSSKSVLEIACGTGQVTRLLRNQLPNAEITATDLNPGMLSLAKQIIPKEDNIEFSIADAQDLPFEAGAFDTVICQFGLMFLPDKQKAINEAYRVLSPGGKYIFNTWDKLETNPISKVVNDIINSHFKENAPDFYSIPFSMCDPAQMEVMLSAAGFNNIKVENVAAMGYSDSAEDAANALVRGTPAFVAIAERDESLIPSILKSAVEFITKEYGSSKIDVPLKAWVAEGVK